MIYQVSPTDFLMKKCLVLSVVSLHTLNSITLTRHPTPIGMNLWRLSGSQ